MFVIESEELTRSYPDQVAVDGLTLQVAAGNVFGLLGPNGAGKTTTVRMLTTLLSPTSGIARINGFDIVKQAPQVREIIGYVPQDAQADEALTGREHLILQGRLYKMSRGTMASRIDEVLDLVGLREEADKRTLHYSGGMRKLLDIACGLLHAPKVLFLDEPTSGIDVAHRSRVIDYIRDLPARGITIFLTSHFLQEVELLADHLALLDHGRLVIQGAPAGLKLQVGSSVADISLGRVEATRAQETAESLRRLPMVTKIIATGSRLKIFAKNKDNMLAAVSQELERLKLPVVSLKVAEPTLDDVFFYHIGREVT